MLHQRDDVTAAVARSLLSYEPETGLLRWRESRGSILAGAIAGGRNYAGYVIIRVRRVLYRAHRLIWLIVTGRWPRGDVDHLNLNKSDNRWENLREATRSENFANRPAGVTNSSGVKGVCWDKANNRWRSLIRVNGQRIDLGRHDNLEDAARAYEEASKRYYGQFAYSPVVES